MGPSLSLRHPPSSVREESRSGMHADTAQAAGSRPVSEDFLGKRLLILLQGLSRRWAGASHWQDRLLVRLQSFKLNFLLFINSVKAEKIIHRITDKRKRQKKTQRQRETDL